MKQFFGKYRGEVSSNRDPQGLGRIQVTVPSVLGRNEVWALPCVPYAGPGVGFLALPPAGASVWVEFEGGDPSNAIWAGCFWMKKADLPADASPEVKVFKTDAITLRLDDSRSEGGFTLQVESPAIPGTLTISCDSDGIALKNGNASVTLDPTTVHLNGDALEVT